MSTRAWRRVGISTLVAGLVTGTLGIAFLLYLLLNAQDDMSDLCDMTEVGEGLLPFGDEGGCNPRWFIWLLAFAFYGIAYGAVPVGLFGSVIAIAASVSVPPPDKPAAD
jgi:hypothetical protein